MTTRYMTCAETAKLIRERLKAEFPGVKFGVRSKTYSGGASIRVEWTDGPTKAQVEAVTGRYAGGRFDGMIDLAYSVDHYLMPDGTATLASSPGSAGCGGLDPKFRQFKPTPDAVRVRFGADYVFTERRHSAGLCKRALDKLARKYGFDASQFEIEDGRSFLHVKGAGNYRVEAAGEYLDRLLYAEMGRRSCYAPPAPKAAA